MAPATAHAENGLEVLHPYLQGLSAAKLDGVARSLKRIVLASNVKPNERSVRAIDQARKDLLKVLESKSFKAAPGLLRNDDRTGVYDLIAQRKPPQPERVDRLAATGLPRITAETMRIALRRESTPYTITVVTKDEIEIDPETGKPVKIPGGTFVLDRTLPGYRGTRLTRDQERSLVELAELIGGGAEQKFRFGVLRAECKRGLGRSDEALQEHSSLLRAADVSSVRKKFVALQAGLGRLERADAAFRRSRTPDAKARVVIAREYDQAVALVEANGVAADNPLRVQIEKHAAKQKAKLAARETFLGLPPGFVPVQRFTQLQADAGAAIEAAQQSAESLQEFIDRAEDLTGQRMDLEAEEDKEKLTGQITVLQLANSGLGVDKVEEQIELIEGQQEALGPQALASVFGSIMQGAATAAASGPGGAIGFATALSGIASTTVNYLAQADELEHQKRIAEIEKDIAENAVSIAALENEISAARLAYLEERQAFLDNKRLDADLLYTLAAISERRAERQLELAIFLTYLFERALAFFLGKPEIAHVSFDYLDRPGGIFDAAKALKEEGFDAVARELDDPALEKADFFEEIVSLREAYPLEFSRFQQTGRMTFEYSLYQLSKDRPASHQCRLREVGVELSPPPPTTGFSGTLTHNGRFLVRDRAATLDPATVRLIPTDEQLEAALEAQREQGLAAAAVGGVICYALPRDAKELSLNTQFVSPPPEQFTLDVFEGYGPTGVWTLEIADHGSLRIQDVLLHFAMVSRESDTSGTGLQGKVKELTRSYEAELAQGDRLDRISPFSLRDAFPDAFFALQSAGATIRLEEKHFPQGLTNLQFKALVVQALDRENTGVRDIGVEIAKPEAGFSQTLVTGENGFSADVGAPLAVLDIDERFPVVGEWQLRLGDVSQFVRLGDIRVFLLYAFEEL